MARYVCDFEVANSTVTKLESLASEMESAINDYDNKVATNCEGWNGVAKQTFIEANANIINELKHKVELVHELSTFIKDSSTAIQETENNLASQNI